MKKSIPVVILVALFTAYYWLHRIFEYHTNDCTPFTEILIQKNDTLSRKILQMDKEILILRQAKDSLILLAREENHLVTKLKNIQREKIQSVDHYTDHELVNFFAKLKTDSLGY